MFKFPQTPAEVRYTASFAMNRYKKLVDNFLLSFVRFEDVLEAKKYLHISAIYTLIWMLGDWESDIGPRRCISPTGQTDAHLKFVKYDDDQNMICVFCENGIYLNKKDKKNVK